MVCKNCHKDNVEGVSFCFYCGSPLEIVDKSNRKSFPKISVFVTLSLVFAAVLVAVALFVIPMLLNSLLPTPKSSSVSLSDIVNAIEQDEPDATVDSVADDKLGNSDGKLEYVIDKDGAVSEQQLQKLQEALEDKSKTLGVPCKVVLDTNYSQSIGDYAEVCCVQECGSSGILLVVDEDRKKARLTANGEGCEFVTDGLVEIIEQDAVSQLQSVPVYDFCIKEIDRIPDSISDAQLYAFKKVDGADQVVYVDSRSGTFTLVDWSATVPKKLFETGTVYWGMDGITDSPSEYRSATPKGTFRLGFALSDEMLNTKLDTVMVNSGTVWVDDPNSDYYNTIQHGPVKNPPKWLSAEDTYSIFSNDVNYACILIEHNGDGYTKGVSGRGSAMYVSGKNQNLSKSYGDVNISASDMRTLLSFLDKSKNPHIVIG